MNLQYKDFEKLLNIGIRLSTEKKQDKLLESILEDGMEITHCDASTLYLFEDNKLIFKIMKTLSMGISRGADGEIINDMPPVSMVEENVCAYTALHREIVNIPNVYDSEQFDFSGPKKYDTLTGYHTKSLLVIPIENNEKELLGVLQLINAMDEAGNIIPFDSQYHLIIRSLASMAAIELTNISHVEELKKQLYSFVEAFATAIDERIPYNGLHTRNVAKYAGILADYVTKKHNEGECKEYFDESHKEQLLLAALLHDIGKMIIPIKVMNRPTRLDKELEKIENRFKLISSYYEVDMLKNIISEEEYKEKLAELDDELEFIRKINTIGYLDDEKYEHVMRLAEKKHIKDDGTVTPYLTDKETEYLCIRRGTLNTSDRRLVESHVVMTEKILSKVYFGEKYSNVKEWASNHHEFLDGSGYPNHLKGKEIGIETRILTVADIFEALTATDRPYKKPVSNEKAFGILRNMAEEGKIEMRLVDWLEESIEEAQNAKKE